MPDKSDIELIREFVQSGSDDAFAGLVQRHVNLVYSAAFRHVTNVAHAEEITQAVFIMLARKAASLRSNTVLEGWLYETTRFACLNFTRQERRRQFREKEACMQSTLDAESHEDSIWTQLAPLLDEAMARLGEKDRHAVILRYFKGNSTREVALAMDSTEAAAQRRVLRAVEKLRHFFTQRGVAVPALTLTALIVGNSVQAAPPTLATSATALGLAKGATAGSSTLTLIKGALKLMAWTKVKTAVAVGAAVLLAAGTTGLVMRHHGHPDTGEYDTPEAAFFSSLSAMNKGNVKALKNSFTPEFRDQHFSVAFKGKSETEQAATVQQAAAMIGAAVITSREPVTHDRVILHIRSPRIGDESVPLKRIDGEWKIDGNLTPDQPARPR